MAILPAEMDLWVAALVVSEFEPSAATFRSMVDVGFSP